MNVKNHVFYLAPLRGVTDYIFRNTFEKYFGTFDYLMSPFIPTVKGTIVNPAVIRDIVPHHNDTTRLIPQIIGNNPSEILVMAKAMADLGYKMVNLNLGCPHTPVTRKRRGSGMLPYPEMIQSILEHVVPSLPCPLSVKLRLGLESEDEINAVLPVLNSFPLYEIIIHPRTGSQMYTGTVNLDCFDKYNKLSVHTVVYNGDIFSAEDYHRISGRFPHINRFMLGRGIVQNPFLLKQIRTGVSQFSLETLNKFHDEIYIQSKEILCGPAHLLGKMKGLWSYLAIPLYDGKRFLKKIQKSESLRGYESAVGTFFEKYVHKSE